MLRVYVNYRSEHDAVDYYRAILPVRHLYATLKAEGIELVASSWMDEGDPFDAYLFHRWPSTRLLDVVRRLKDRGKKVLWELDDDLWSIPDWSPAAQYLCHTPALEAALEMADTIIVSTEPLACVVRARTNRPVVVCPNLIDASAWPAVLPRQPGAAVRIVWAGTSTHEKDLEQVVEPLQRIVAEYGSRVEVRMMGYAHPAMPRSWFVPGVRVGDYPKALAALRPDIGLLPLADVPFNASKSAVKFFEMTLAGAACLANPVGPYRTPGIEMCLDWQPHIDEMIRCPGTLGLQRDWGRSLVLRWNSWQHSPGRESWVEVFRGLKT